MSARPVAVSDHALLRYLERVKGIDVAAARTEIEALIGSAGMLGDAALVRAGHIFVVEAYRVTTVLPRGAHYAFNAVQKRQRNGARR
jgi:hypothetical protein